MKDAQEIRYMVHDCKVASTASYVKILPRLSEYFLRKKARNEFKCRLDYLAREVLKDIGTLSVVFLELLKFKKTNVCSSLEPQIIIIDPVQLSACFLIINFRLAVQSFAQK